MGNEWTRTSKGIIWALGLIRVTARRKVLSCLLPSVFATQNYGSFPSQWFSDMPSIVILPRFWKLMDESSASVLSRRNRHVSPRSSLMLSRRPMWQYYWPCICFIWAYSSLIICLFSRLYSARLCIFSVCQVWMPQWIHNDNAIAASVQEIW